MCSGGLGRGRQKQHHQEKASGWSEVETWQRERERRREASLSGPGGASIDLAARPLLSTSSSFSPLTSAGSEGWPGWWVRCQHAYIQSSLCFSCSPLPCLTAGLSDTHASNCSTALLASHCAPSLNHHTSYSPVTSANGCHASHLHTLCIYNTYAFLWNGNSDVMSWFFFFFGIRRALASDGAERLREDFSKTSWLTITRRVVGYYVVYT